MGLAQMGLAINDQINDFRKKWIRSKLDAYKAQMTHTLHAQNPRYPQYFSKPLGPWAMTNKGLWTTYFFYSFFEFWFFANPIGANPIRGPQTGASF